jgi:hypothetical protein
LAGPEEPEEQPSRSAGKQGKGRSNPHLRRGGAKDFIARPPDEGARDARYDEKMSIFLIVPRQGQPLA